MHFLWESEYRSCFIHRVYWGLLGVMHLKLVVSRVGSIAMVLAVCIFFARRHQQLDGCFAVPMKHGSSCSLTAVSKRLFFSTSSRIFIRSLRVVITAGIL